MHCGASFSQRVLGRSELRSALHFYWQKMVTMKLSLGFVRRSVLNGIVIALFVNSSLCFAAGLEEFKSGVVRIAGVDKDGSARVGGGFVYLIKDGVAYIITASHVVGAEKHPSVTFYPGLEPASAGTVLNTEGEDAPYGLALLTVSIRPGANPMPRELELNLGVPLKVAQQYFAIGFPNGGGSWAVVPVSYSSSPSVGTYDSFSPSLSPGMSGGPFITDRGSVIALDIEKNGSFERSVSLGTISNYVHGLRKQIYPDKDDELILAGAITARDSVQVKNLIFGGANPGRIVNLNGKSESAFDRAFDHPSIESLLPSKEKNGWSESFMSRLYQYYGLLYSDVEHINAIESFLKAGASPNVRVNGELPCLAAIDKGHYDFADLLQRYGGTCR